MRKRGSEMERFEQPIGVFDSGVGGVSVLRELIRLMPYENYIFFGDSLRAPYGSKTLQEVRSLTEQHVGALLAQGVKAVVIACNTATSADVSILRGKYPGIPIIGIEPALKPAVLSAEHPRVLVLATPMTIREEKFCRLMKQYETQAEIMTQPCPELVRFVERGDFDSEELKAYLHEVLDAYRKEKWDAVVLGCTHFPFVKHAIQEVLENQTAFFDGGSGVARETKRRLKEQGLLQDNARSGRVVFQNSDSTKTKLCRKLAESQ